MPDALPVVDLPAPTIEDMVLLYEAIETSEDELGFYLEDERAAHARVLAALVRAGVVEL